MEMTHVQTTLYTIENKGLFSSHFLEHQLKESDEWKELTNLEGKYAQISALYESKKAMLSKANESQLRSEFIDHVLKSLCHHFAIEGAIKGTAKRPDYGLFPGEESANEAQINQVEGFYKNAIGICEAKQWDVKLDERDLRSGGIDRRTPNRQIDEYLHRSEVKWGILTNGRFWRIYYRENSYRNYYFQIDLAQTIESKDPEAFKYFFLFFRRDAFLPDTNNRCFLDKVYQGSIDYGKEIGENIQENVYKAMKVLAEGFIDWKENNLSKSEETLKSVQDNTMILLYRLLFIYFAEANNLLDVRGATKSSLNYTNNYSLDALKKNIRNRLENGEDIPLYQAEYWGKLQTLFKFIDKGTEAMGIPKDELYIPSYNGGLFDTKKHSFLSRYKINDMSLAHAILLLSCPKGPLGLDRGFFDYSSLDIRHLGSIYEGLLEFKLKVAEEPMVAAKLKGKEIWTPEKDFKGKKYFDRIVEGDLYLTTDKGERKATGSYYTPEYIVKYIVKSTVWPVAKRKRKEAEEENRKCSDAVLSIKVLDPAMGSGHFLVEVVDFLAMVLGDAINRDIERGLIEEGEYPDDWLRREIVSHCVYGVDLNPMAVELAKVALWLKTISKDKPLSFLDHRLKCGNSLIGANLVDLPWYPQMKKKKKEIAESQQRLDIPEGFVKKLVETVDKISDIRDDTIDDIKRKEEIFRDFKETREYDMIKTLADVRTSVYFGNEVDEATYGRFSGDAFFNSEKQWTEQKRRWFVREGVWVGDEKRFFHWELEFPEVFFEEGNIKENPGFDVVICNPPYIDIKSLTKIFVKYLFKAYSTTHWRINVFASFLEQALEITKDEYGHIGYIIPTAFLTQISYSHLRHIILTNHWLRNIVRLPNELFGETSGEVKVDTCILIINKNQPTFDLNTTILIYDSFKRTDEISSETATTPFKAQQRRWMDIDGSPILLTRNEEFNIIDKIQINTTPLEDYCEFCLGLTPYDKYKGHTAEQIKNKVFHSNSQINSTYKKLLLSGDVKRYKIEWNGENWINYGPWLGAPREQRFFTEERILVQQIIDWSSLRIFAGWTEEEFYNTQNQFNLLGRNDINLKFILSIFISRLMSFFHRKVFLDIALQRFQKVLIKDAKTFPIKYISFTTSPNLRKDLTDQAISLHSVFLTSGDREPLLAFVSERLSHGPEQSDVVHDLLAYLAERMIEMNKEKQKEIRGFLKWLEGEIGIKADDMTLKTKIKDYYKYDWEGFLKALKRNKKKINVMDITRRTPQEKIREEFDSSLGKLTPLLAKIETTDRLIDQVVYRLYGLTEEEVEIIEKQQSI